MASLEKPILTRLNRLDNILKELEEIQHSPKSSYASTTSSGTLTSDGHPSSVAELSPDHFEKRCRPVEEVMMEVEEKGSFIHRLLQVEDRILKLSLRLEEELEGARNRQENESEEKKTKKKSPKKSSSLKQLVKAIKPSHKTKTSTAA